MREREHLSGTSGFSPEFDPSGDAVTKVTHNQKMATIFFGKSDLNSVL